MEKLLVLLAAFVVALPFIVRADAKEDREAVKQAVLDYVEGIYEVNPARIERSVHPDLAKTGFYRKEGETTYAPGTMTFARLLEVAKNFNKNGWVPKNAPKEVIIYDVLDQTATVKLVAVWGIDYMHLAKYDGKWKIVNVLWQSPPKTSP